MATKLFDNIILSNNVKYENILFLVSYVVRLVK